MNAPDLLEAQPLFVTSNTEPKHAAQAVLRQPSRLSSCSVPMKVLLIAYLAQDPQTYVDG